MPSRCWRWSCCCLGAWSAQEQATDPLAPTGLSDGDTYRILFVTSTAVNPTDRTDIAQWNAAVQAVADGSRGLAGIEFKIVGSTASVDARDNTNTRSGASHDGDGEPIYYFMGDKVADDYADLWDGNWDSDAWKDENGKDFKGQPVVWTGSNADGTAFSGNDLGAASVKQGCSTFTLSDTVECGGVLTYSAGTVYALSRVLTKGSPPVDYDSDDDGWIDIKKIAHLDAVRYDLDGDGDPDEVSGEAAYNDAFDNRLLTMGCPSTGCIGYELMNSLDLDVDPYNTGAGWTPIGGAYNAEFHGNNKKIDNLFINANTGWLGLFRDLGSNAEVHNLGLRYVDITNTGTEDRVGGLAGRSDGGTILGVWVTGSVTSGGARVGGLLGENRGAGAGTIGGSFARVAVSGSGSVGGLVGSLFGGEVIASYARGGSVTATGDNVGGLVGATSKGAGDITISYASVAVSGNANVGGLLGNLQPVSDTDTTTGTITASYSGQFFGSVAVGSDDADGSGAIDGSETASAPSHPDADLAEPVAYLGIYETWDDHDVDGDDINDRPWLIGSNKHYPILQFGGLNQDADQPRDLPDVIDEDGDGLIDVSSVAQLAAIAPRPER